MTDTKNYTVLSCAAYRNNTNCFKILFEYGQKYISQHYKDEPEEHKKFRMKQWANTPSDSHFVPLHFAAKHGNYLMLTYLVEKAGVDLYVKNKFGSTVMHIAAQNDQPISLYYFWKRGMDVNIRDQKDSTPLHWACYTRSELAMSYILSMKPNLEAKDV